MDRANPGTAVREELVLGFADLHLRRIPLEPGRLTIGRLPDNDLVLDDGSVSGRHAVVRTENGRRRLEDLGSRNGTVVNGASVQSKLLDSGDLIQVGIYSLRYVLERPAGDAGSGTTDASGVSSDARAWLRFVSGAGAGSEQPLSRSIHPLRGAGNQIAIVSRRREGWVITHLEGSSVPRVNGVPVGIGARPLRDGDLVELDGRVARFSVGA